MKTTGDVKGLGPSHDLFADVPPEVSHDASTRGRVARSILEHGPSTAAELAERLNLTPAAVRRHLAVLLENGHLVARERRVYGTRGRGRPAKVFALTDAGRQDFYQAYDRLAVQALEFLRAAGGQAAVEAFAETMWTELADAFSAEIAQAPVAETADAAGVLAFETQPALRDARSARSSGTTAAPQAADSETLNQRVQSLVNILNRQGFVASLHPVQTGQQLCQYHCPVAHVAAEFPELCVAETKVFSQLLGSHVQRIATIAHADGVCTTHIPHPVNRKVSR